MKRVWLSIFLQNKYRKRNELFSRIKSVRQTYLLTKKSGAEWSKRFQQQLNRTSQSCGSEIEAATEIFSTFIFRKYPEVTLEMIMGSHRAKPGSMGNLEAGREITGDMWKLGTLRGIWKLWVAKIMKKMLSYGVVGTTLGVLWQNFLLSQ